MLRQSSGETAIESIGYVHPPVSSQWRHNTKNPFEGDYCCNLSDKRKVCRGWQHTNVYGLVQWALHCPPALSHCIQILAYAPETKIMCECQRRLLSLMADGLQGVSTERYFRFCKYPLRCIHCPYCLPMADTKGNCTLSVDHGEALQCLTLSAT